MADVYVYAPAREQGEADIFVGVNGKGYRVPRGRTVKLPEEVAGALVNGYPEAMIITEGVVGTGLGSLSDVDIATPTNGQTLVYDSTAGKWENGAGGGGGGNTELVETVNTETGVAITSHTWQEIYDALKAGKLLYSKSVAESESGEAAVGNYYCAMAEHTIFEGEEHHWGVEFFSSGAVIMYYEATSADSYPVYTY